MNATVAYTRFVAEYPKDRGALHAFFEGDDDESFYVGFINTMKPSASELHRYRCKNKKGVYYVYGKLDWRNYDKRRVLFFVDKDHAELVGESYPADSNIYVTDLYSIENYIVAEPTFHRCIRELFHIDADGPGTRSTLSRFREQLSRFHEMMILVDAWIVFMRRNGFTPHLNNVQLSELFTIDDSLQITRRRGSMKNRLQLLERKTGVRTPANSRRAIRHVARELQNAYEAKHHLRGKYEMWFLVEYLRKVRELAEKVKTEEDRNKVVRVDISVTNAVQELATRTPMPPSLRFFLERQFRDGS